MLFDLNELTDAVKAAVHFNKLIEKKCVIELSEKKPKRSLNQNSYLHVCITLFAIEFGYTLAEAKTLLKRNCSFMVYEKNGVKFLRQTSKQDSRELTEFIEFIRNYASVQGLYIPTSEEYILNQISIDKSIYNNKHFLWLTL